MTNTEKRGKHCLNPDTCNPDKGSEGCVCSCQGCLEGRVMGQFKAQGAGSKDVQRLDVGPGSIISQAAKEEINKKYEPKRPRYSPLGMSKVSQVAWCPSCKQMIDPEDRSPSGLRCGRCGADLTIGPGHPVTIGHSHEFYQPVAPKDEIVLRLKKKAARSLVKALFAYGGITNLGMLGLSQKDADAVQDVYDALKAALKKPRKPSKAARTKKTNPEGFGYKDAAAAVVTKELRKAKKGGRRG